MKLSNESLLMLLSYSCYLLLVVEHIAAGKVEADYAEVFPDAPAAAPGTSPVQQAPAPVQHNIGRELFNNKAENIKNLISNDNSEKEYTDEGELKEYRSILDRILNTLLEKENDLHNDVETKDLTNRAIGLPITYGVNLDVIGKLHYNGKFRPGRATDSHTCDQIRNVPNNLRSKGEMWPKGIQSHYTKYTEAYGIPVIGSDKVTDKGMKRACYIVRLLFADRYDIRQSYFECYGRVAIIANGEETTDLPEYSHMDRHWNTRSRGLGALIDNPTSSVGDDNLRCCCGDRYTKEDILLHELAHGAHLIGAVFVIPGFAVRLTDAYASAMSKGLWNGEYAATNVKEYWAVGTTYYFNTRGWYKLKKPNGVTVKGSGQTVLNGYDPTLFSLLQEVFPCNNILISRCAYKACTNGDFDKLQDKSAGKSLTGCNHLATETDLSLAECYTRTCISEGDAFNFVSGECQVMQCSSISYTSSKGGYHVYKLKSTTKFVMDLAEESNAVLTKDCVQRDPTLDDRCAAVTDPIYFGNINKATCKVRGYCYYAGNCFYPKQDCADKLLECNLAADTCETNKYFMLPKCPFTCGVCQYVRYIDEDKTQKFCHDKNLKCKKWATSGECDINPSYMNSACPLSCNNCNKPARCDAVANSIRETCTADTKEMCYMKGCCWKNGNCFYPSG